MKKSILILSLLLINSMFSSTLKNLDISDNEFIEISSSSQKNIIFDRINQLMLLKKSLNGVDDESIKIKATNSFFNEYLYQTDKKIYNKEDYWATRKEFLIKGAGDCEDFVIAKYFTLLELGISEDKLSLIHGLRKDEYHLVLGYQENPTSEILILDNINKTILPLLQRDDFVVLYTLELADLENLTGELTNFKTLNYKWTTIYNKNKLLN